MPRVNVPTSVSRSKKAAGDYVIVATSLSLEATSELDRLAEQYHITRAAILRLAAYEYLANNSGGDWTNGHA